MTKKTKKHKENEPNTQPIPKPAAPIFDSIPFKYQKDESGIAQIHFNPNLKEDRRSCFLNSMGVKDAELAVGIFVQAAQSVSSNSNDDLSRNTLAQSIHDFQPKDAIEARLVAQATVAFQHGMHRLAMAGNAEFIHHLEAQVNMAVKLLRVHNETVETLNRYRRGGEQRVIVQHNVVADKAIVNNFPGGRVHQEKNGDSPCQQNAEPKPEPTAIDHVVSQQWPMEGVDFTEDLVQGPKPQKGAGG